MQGISDGTEKTKGMRAMRMMLDEARRTLGEMALGAKGGPRARNYNLSFESALDHLIPEDAGEERIISEIATLLDVNRSAVQRAIRCARTSTRAHEHASTHTHTCTHTHTHTCTHPQAQAQGRRRRD